MKRDPHGCKLFPNQTRFKIQNFIKEKKKKTSAHSFSPFALMVVPSKEKWSSEIYFLPLGETNTKNYRKLPKGAHVALAVCWGQIPPCDSVIFGIFHITEN